MQMECLLQQTIRLKKELHVTRNRNDDLSQANLQLHHNLELQQQKTQSLTQQYTALHKSLQASSAQSSRTSENFIAQIEQLKDLIESKQRALQDLQIKLIPNLDHDMVRVKIIAEMEGPHQQAVEKKDREIEKLRDRLSCVTRKRELLEVSLEGRTSQFKKEIQEVRDYYQEENQRIMREVTHLVASREVGSIDREFSKRQQREIQELRSLLEFESQHSADRENTIDDLRHENQGLFTKISILNDKLAIQQHNSHNSHNITAMKQQRARIEQLLINRQADLQRSDRKLKSLQKQYRRLQEEQRKQNETLLMRHYRQIQSIREQLKDEKNELRRLKDINHRQQSDYLQICKKHVSFEKELNMRRQQCSVLRERMAISASKQGQSDLNVRAYKEVLRDKEALREREGEGEEKRGKQGIRKQNIGNNSYNMYQRNEGNNRSGNEKQERQKYIDQQQRYKKQKMESAILHKKNKHLSEKLQFANRKIIELIKQKVQASENSPNIARHRCRSHYSPENDNKGRNAFLLEFRDSSLLPLVTPTIYTHLQK